MCKLLFHLIFFKYKRIFHLTCQEQGNIATANMKPHVDDTDLKRNMSTETAGCVPYEYICLLCDIVDMRLITKSPPYETPR
jgi:hypothetical protein